MFNRDYIREKRCYTAEYRRGEGDGDVGEVGRGVGVDRGDDDGPRLRSGATGSKGERAPLLLLLP